MMIYFINNSKRQICHSGVQPLNDKFGIQPPNDKYVGLAPKGLKLDTLTIETCKNKK